jgi:hypothetical protein
VLGDEGIRRIYGMTGEESAPILLEAARKLGSDVTGDYWEATGGNAAWALMQLRALAMKRPDGVWRGD